MLCPVCGHTHPAEVCPRCEAPTASPGLLASESPTLVAPVDPAADAPTLVAVKAGAAEAPTLVDAAEAATKIDSGSAHAVLDAGASPGADAPTLRPQPQSPGKAAELAIRAALERSGKYRIERVLGQGGMGMVYLARDVHLKRRVALKVIRSDAPGSTLENRFLHEAQAAAKLSHPSVVKVYEVGRASGLPYIAMEYLEGETLASLLKRNRLLPPRAAFKIALQLCQALRLAHAQGVIHRDIKPANILISARDDGPPEPRRNDSQLQLESSLTSSFRAVLLDFGLARIIEKDTRLTQSGQVFGTPAYMSPEQANGDIHQIGPPSDLYSLGSVLYEMLTGRPPFLASSSIKLITAILTEEPAAPRTLCPSLHVDAETVTLKSMAKDPERRYTSAADLAEDLRRYLAGDSILARPPSKAYKACLLVRRNKLASLSVALLLLIVTVTGTLRYLQTGGLRLRVGPQGALIEVLRGPNVVRSLIATGRDLPAERLAAGIYDVQVRLEGHEPRRFPFQIERGETQSLDIELVHTRGQVVARCEPEGSWWIGGTEYGSYVGGQSFETGRLRLTARKLGFFGVEREVEVLPKSTVSTYCWLDQGFVLPPFRSPHLQGHTLPLADLDGDGRPELAVQAMERVLVFSTGAESTVLDDLPASEHPRWRFDSIDLGRGPRLFIWCEERGGLLVRCYDLLGEDDWEFRGPAEGSAEGKRSALVVLGDRNADGVQELATAGVSGQLYIVDGAGGALLAQQTLSEVPLVHCPALAPLESSCEQLLYLARYGGVQDARRQMLPGQFGCLDLASGRQLWSAEQPAIAMWNDYLLDIDSDGVHEVWWLDGKHWRVVDGLNGALRWSGPWPETALPRGGHAVGDLDGDGMAEMAIHDQVDGMVVLDIKSGVRRWTLAGASGLQTPGTSGLRAPGHSWQRGPGGELLCATAGGLLAVRPEDGSVAWQAPGQPKNRHLLVEDWDGDGVAEIFYGSSEGLVCLDQKGRRLWVLDLDAEARPDAFLGDVDGDGLGDLSVVFHGAWVAIVRGPRVLWQQTAAAALRATPLLADVSGDGIPEVLQNGRFGDNQRFACFDGRTGTRLWSTNWASTDNRAPALGDWDGDGQLDVGWLVKPAAMSGLWHLQVVRASDGALVFEQKELVMRGDTYSVPVIADLNGDGQADLATHRYFDRDIVAYDGRDGSVLWSVATADNNMGGVAAEDLSGDGLPDIVAPSFDGRLYAVEGTTGETLWTASLGEGGSRSPPCLADLNGDACPEVMLVTVAGELRVVDGSSGTVLWTAVGTGATDSFGKPSVAETEQGTLLITPLGDAGVVAFHWPSRTVVWQASEGSVHASPLVVDLDGDGLREVVIATMQAQLHVVDLLTGRELWRAPVKGPVEGDPVAADFDRDGVLDLVVADHSGALQVISGRGTRGGRARLP